MSIKVQNLTKIYGVQKAVNNLNFEIKKGEIVGFLGPNGAGKSTTMKILTTYISPTNGSAEVCGIDVSKHSQEVKKRVGYLPESNPLYYDMYVLEYLDYVARIHKISNRYNVIKDVVERVGLTKEKNKKIGSLSKGYKQRVGIAQAIIHDPEVLILDEPTSGLDPLQLDEIRSLIRSIGQDKTVMLSTHIMQEVEAMCQRVMIINNGVLAKDYQLNSSVKSSDNTENAILHIALKNPDLKGIDSYMKGIKIDFHPNQTNEFFLSGNEISEMKKRLMKYSLEMNNEILFMKEYIETLEEVFKKATR